MTTQEMNPVKQVARAKKMKMIFNILPSSYPMEQELLDELLKTPIFKLEGILTEMRLKQIYK